MTQRERKGVSGISGPLHGQGPVGLKKTFF